MKKRIIAIAVMTVTVLSVFGFAGCGGFNLAEYKANGREAIQSHADAKIAENGYTDAGLQAIAQAVAEGKATVDAAENRTTVDIAVNAAKEKINAVSKKSENSIVFEEASLGGYFIVLNDEELTQTIIANKNELIAFFDNHEIAWANGVPLWECYSDEFFEESALLLYFAVTPSISVTYVLYDISMTSGSLILHIEAQIYGNVSLDAEGFISFVIEVRKSDIKGAEDFDVDIKGKTLSQKEKNGKAS
jgi:hypothetical protein